MKPDLGLMMNKIKIWVVLMPLTVILVAALLSACSLSNGYKIMTINDSDQSVDSGILSLALPGIVPSPQELIEATGLSVYVKTPHALEGRVGFCFDCHGLNGDKPAPASHLGRPQDSCTVCHRPAWEVANQ